MAKLRPYQQSAVDQIRLAYMEGHRRVVFVLPTGGGKTVTFTHIAESAAARGNRVMVLVHREELLNQSSRAMAAAGVSHGLIAAGRGMNLTHSVQIASVQTLARRLHLIHPDYLQLVIVDECHHTNASTWVKTLEHFKRAHLLGVTATPCRADGRGLGEHYTKMVQGPSAAWLTENGYLAQARVFAPPVGFDESKVRTRMGDFATGEASEQLEAPSAMGDVVGHYCQHLQGKTAIAFCCTVVHAEALAASFRMKSIAAASIDGKMSGEQRRDLLHDLGTGQLKVLTSCNLIGEGVDVPSVSGCILARPTKSVSLHLQMIGRCLRPSGDKVAVILDHVGNLQRLGHHLDDQGWTLDGAKKKAKKAPSVKVCPSCFAAVSSTVSKCGECGHVFRTAERAPLEFADGQLQELTPEALQAQRAERRRRQAGAQSMEMLIQLGREQGMKNPEGWAKHVARARQAKHSRR